MQLDPRQATLIAGAFLAVGLLAALATGGRAQALISGLDHGVRGHVGGAFGFKLAKVRLQGVSEGAAPDVLAAAGLTAGTSILDIDLEAVRQRVQAVGWVKGARVVRLLPDTLLISAEERPRLAVWQVGGQSVVVDTDGRPIPEADPGRFADLPLVVGEGAATAAGTVLPQIASRPRLAQRLDALVRVDGRRWDLRLKDGALIQLPPGREDAALIQLDQLDQKARLLELGFARIDLRDPEVVTVRPRSSGEAESQSATPAKG